MSRKLASQPQQVYCNSCRDLKNHIVQKAHTTNWNAGDVGGTNCYEMLTCDVCGDVTYRTVRAFSETLEQDEVHYFPARQGMGGRERKDFNGLDPDDPVFHVYDETIATLNGRHVTLSAAGVRLLIEGICKKRSITGGPLLDGAGNQRLNKNGAPIRGSNLEGKINGLAESGVIALEQAGQLHQIRFLGNDAAHELDRPTVPILNAAIEIVEHMLCQVYVQPEKAKTLAGRTRPAR